MWTTRRMITSQAGRGGPMDARVGPPTGAALPARVTRSCRARHDPNLATSVGPGHRHHAYGLARWTTRRMVTALAGRGGRWDGRMGPSMGAGSPPGVLVRQRYRPPSKAHPRVPEAAPAR